MKFHHISMVVMVVGLLCVTNIQSKGVVVPASTSMLSFQDAQQSALQWNLLFDNSRLFKYNKVLSKARGLFTNTINTTTRSPLTTTTSTTTTAKPALFKKKPKANYRYFAPLFDELPSLIESTINEKRSAKIPDGFKIYEAVPKDHKF